MNFNAPIANQKMPSYNEGSALAPARDDRNVGLLWKKVRDVQKVMTEHGRALEKTVQQISKMRRKPLGGYIPTPATTMVYPFCLYNIQNISATEDQIALFTAQGANINDYTVQIRSGVISARPYINNPNGSGGIYAFNGLIGNFEVALYCTNTDQPPTDQSQFSNPILDWFFYPQTPNKGVSIVIDNVNPTLICGIPANSPAGTQAIFSDQICLNPTVDGSDQFQSCSAAFWIELIDDPNNGFYANLMGQMFTLDPPTARTSQAFPTGANVYPIGIYIVGANLNADSYLPLIPSDLEQVLSQNVLNRFPVGTASQRGFWSIIFAALPAGKTYLWFYPGDIVVDDTLAVPISDTTNVYGVYQAINPSPFESLVSENPASSGGYWGMIGMVISYV